MLYNSLHHRGLRLFAGIFGSLISAIALNLFIVPLSLYTGGLMGLCQLTRTLLQNGLGLDLGTHDIAGLLYFGLNVPILLLASKSLGREIIFKTLVCTLSYTAFYSIIPIPSMKRTEPLFM